MHDRTEIIELQTGISDIFLPTPQLDESWYAEGTDAWKLTL